MTISLALGAAAGLVLLSWLLLPAGESAPRWSFFARIFLTAVWIALMIADAYGGYGTLRSPTFAMIALATGAGAALLLLHSAVRNWRDEEALAGEFGPQDGYIVRRHLLSPKARAVIGIFFLFAIIALTAWLALQTSSFAE